MSTATNFPKNSLNITNQSFFDFSAPIRLRKQVKQDILQEVNLTLFKSRHETIMKLISTDFSNLGKKTLYDFGDDEAINELLKEHKSTRDEITRDFFKAIEKEFDKYWKKCDKSAKDGWVVD